MWSTWHRYVRAPRASTVLKLEAEGMGELWVTGNPNIPPAPNEQLVPECYKKTSWCRAMVFKLCSLEPKGCAERLRWDSKGAVLL